MMTSSKRTVAGLVVTVRAKGTAMIKRSLDWLVAGNDSSANEDTLQHQLDGARELHSAALAQVELAVAALDSAANAATAETAADALTRAHAEVERAAAYLARAQRAIVRREAERAAAKLAELEQRKATLEATLEPNALDAEAYPLEEQEARLLERLVELRGQRAALKSAACARLGELRHVVEALGLDTTGVELSLSLMHESPNHSRIALLRVEELASSFPPDDVRRGIALDLVHAVIAPHAYRSTTQQPAEPTGRTRNSAPGRERDNGDRTNHAS